MPNHKKVVSSPDEFDADSFPQPAIALQAVQAQEYSGITPHAHRKGQLILSLYGAVSCEVQNDLWLAE